MRFNNYIRRFLTWRNKNISDKVFLLLLCLLVGLISGVTAAVIKNSVHLVEYIVTSGIAAKSNSFQYFLLPLLGIAITTLIIRYIVKEPVGHGIPSTLYSISKGKGIIKVKNMYSSWITAAVTVGFGGSTGLEGPSVGTTTAISSNLARLVRVDYKKRKLLIGCAAAGSLAAIFKAPIAAIIFAIEVIMLDLTMGSLIPLLVSSVAAVLTSQLFYGDDVLFHFKIKDTMDFSQLPFFILLGVVAGLVSVYFTKTHFFISRFFEKIKSSILKVLIGGSLLGLIIYLFPSIYGEGYSTINRVIEGNHQDIIGDSILGNADNIIIILLFLVGTIFLKAIATNVTFSAGGVGGIFAPTLFMGSLTGYVFSIALASIGFTNLSISNFTLVGMAGMMAGILQAPLTAIFLIAEITGGYELFIPLMITASISYLTVKYFVEHSVYTMMLAKRGELITHDKDQAVLTLMNLKDEIESNFVTVHPYQNLGELVKSVANSSRNLFPVVDEKNYLIGVVSLNEIRDIMFNTELYEKMLVHELMTIPPEHIYISDSMEIVMQKFESSGAWNLPVLADGRYIGFVSKSKLFSAYRNQLKEFYDNS